MNKYRSMANSVVIQLFELHLTIPTFHYSNSSLTSALALALALICILILVISYYFEVFERT